MTSLGPRGGLLVLTTGRAWSWVGRSTARCCPLVSDVPLLTDMFGKC